MKIKLNISLILSFILTTSCIETSKSNIPKRPINVPISSFWIGGYDGGQWYKISQIDSIAEVVHFVIYNDNDGSIVSNKNFKLNCNRNVPFQWQKIQDCINGFDGNRILLNEISSDKSWCYFE